MDWDWEVVGKTVVHSFILIGICKLVGTYTPWTPDTGIVLAISALGVAHEAKGV